MEAFIAGAASVCSCCCVCIPTLGEKCPFHNSLIHENNGAIESLLVRFERGFAQFVGPLLANNILRNTAYLFDGRG